MNKLNLPININDLLTARTVEWERLEFKAGWNPEDVLHTMCAFANDFHNLGGGYIVIGIEEKAGRPVLPPKGLPVSQIDKIQKEILNLGHSAIQPSYHPLTAQHQISGKNILILWVPGGETRPYKAKVSLSKKSKEWGYFIRKQSSTVRAKGTDERELIRSANTIPFDDRYNQSASVGDLSKRLMEEFLQEVHSELLKEAKDLSSEVLGRQMNIVGGPSESVFPKNVGLLFFNEKPDRFFPVTQMDVVWFPDGPGGDRFEEKIFKGPLSRMTRDALAYIQRTFLKETVIKHPDRAKAERFWNFPYAAIEEAIVNAVYHRSYEVREPIEVRITAEDFVVLSFPGPDRSIRMENLRAGKAISRCYRNRRIGEFLKELDMTEGRSTGIPKILRAMKNNGSPQPEFETDDDRAHFLIRLPIHPKANKAIVEQLGAQSGAQTGAQSDQILRMLLINPLSMIEIVHSLKLKSKTGALKRAVKDLLSEEYIEYTVPEKPASRSQKYRLTQKGKEKIEL
jgi:ATP-dependent DNA helicase RecG